MEKQRINKEHQDKLYETIFFNGYT